MDKTNGTRICLDTETTGLKAGDDEVLTLSIADFDGNELYRGMFRPQTKTEWPDAEKINGISPETVADCPAITDCVDEIQQVIDSASEIYGYNIMFDVGFLRAVGVEIPQAKLHDTMMDFAAIRARELDLPKIKRCKLVDAAIVAEHFWGELGAHDAMEDVRATVTVQKWCDAMRASLAGPADDPEGLVESLREKCPGKVADGDVLIAVYGQTAWIGNPERIDDEAIEVEIDYSGDPVRVVSDNWIAANDLSGMLEGCWNEAQAPDYLNHEVMDLKDLAEVMGWDHAQAPGQKSEEKPAPHRRGM